MNRGIALAWLAPLLLGAACVLGFAPFHVFPLPVAALAAWLHLLGRCTSVRAAVASGLCFGLGLFLAGVSWVYVSLHFYGGMAMPLAALFTLLFCLYLACFPAAVAALLARAPAPTAAKWLLAFPALWALSEWVRGWFLSGFPWLAIGYSQVPHPPFAGYMPVLGVFGVSLVCAAAAGALAWFAQGAMRRRERDGRRTMIQAGLVLAVLALGGAALHPVAWTRTSTPPTTVALLQGNIPQELKWRPERALATLDTYLQLALAADAQLIVLPETALPMLNVDVPGAYLQALGDHARARGGDLLVGVPELEASTGRYFNSVMTVGSAPPQTYRKHHLVPFGDYFPLRPLLGWVMEILHIPMSDFSHGGPVQQPLAVAGQKIAANICYEDAFGEEVIRQLPQATLLANFTNDAWWGDSIASKQHLQIAQARSLETGRPMLRATNTGVTAIIDARGRIAASAPGFATATVSGQVTGHSGSTPYVRWGNYGFIAVAVAMLLAAAWGARRRRA
ncbi:MAG TPA: apolipoprotein N-acyltransferase [Burkholderiales bacterium]|nr:apolipoprotein N-acyltransferase [Burkholderiales bacterium]